METERIEVNGFAMRATMFVVRNDEQTHISSLPEPDGHRPRGLVNRQIDGTIVMKEHHKNEYETE
jgi:hypothetical protein